jgi:hypothetical protein
VHGWRRWFEDVAYRQVFIIPALLGAVAALILETKADCCRMWAALVRATARAACERWLETAVDAEILPGWPAVAAQIVADRAALERIGGRPVEHLGCDPAA